MSGTTRDGRMTEAGTERNRGGHPPPDTGAAGEAADDSRPEARGVSGADAPAFVEHLLARRGEETPGQLTEAEVLSWSEDAGTLMDGRAARSGVSCLLRPLPGDRVLVWSSGAACWILAVLQRPDGDSPAVVAVPGAAALEASRLAISAQSVHIAAGDLLTTARNIQSVANTRTESSRLRVTQIGTDVRRAQNVDDSVGGTLLQRMGTWVSATVREARLTARTFLFN